MSNVQEALKAAVEALEDAATHTVFSYEATINECKAALSEIEKCEGWVSVDDLQRLYDDMFRHKDIAISANSLFKLIQAAPTNKE